MDSKTSSGIAANAALVGANKVVVVSRSFKLFARPVTNSASARMLKSGELKIMDAFVLGTRMASITCTTPLDPSKSVTVI